MHTVFSRELIEHTADQQVSAIKDARVDKFLYGFLGLFLSLSLIGIGLLALDTITLRSETGLLTFVISVGIALLTLGYITAYSVVPKMRISTETLFLHLNIGTPQETTWVKIRQVSVSRKFLFFRYVYWHLEDGRTIRRRLQGTFWSGGEMVQWTGSGFKRLYYDAFDLHSHIAVVSQKDEKELLHEKNRIIHLMRAV